MSIPRYDSERTDCPSEEVLESFSLGRLSDSEIENVGEHLRTCHRCRCLLDIMEPSDDSLVAYFKRTQGKRADEKDVRDLASRLGKMLDITSDSPAWPETSSDERNPALCNQAAVPDQLGQYRLVEVIGRGAMGTVYRAWHSKLKRVVAVKLLSPKRLNDYQAVARFSREMEAIGKLDDHPNIVRARDAGEMGGHHFLVMDFVDGIDAGLLVFRIGKLFIADACEITRQAALGLDYAHRRGIVHRDVKPSNLLVSQAGVAKVSDLGLVAFGSESRDGRSVVGTADYMAPEQWVGSAEADHRADIYGLGCTLYKLLVGRAPYSDRPGSRRDKMNAHLKAPLPIVSEILPKAVGELDAVVKKMLAKKPTDRFEWASDVAGALESLASGSDLAALVRQVTSAGADTERPISEITLVERYTVADRKRNQHVWWRKAAAGAIGVVLLFATIFWTLRGGHTAQVEPQALFLRYPDDVRWQYNAQQGTLNLDTDGFALFRCGSVENRKYTIRTTMVQKDWQGEAGIFFDYRKEQGGNREIFHMVGVRRLAAEPDGATHELISSVVKFESNARGGKAMTWSDHYAAPLTIDMTTLRHTLKVTVADGKLHRVMWDGEEVIRIDDADEDGPSSPIPVADFGIFGRSGVTIFEDTRLLGD